MPEQTEIERIQKNYVEQLDQQRMQSEHQFQVAMKLQDSRVAELRQNFEERRKELFAQNDGLLGAVGRLHKENENLKSQVADLEAQLTQTQNESKSELLNAHRESDLKHIEMMNEFSESRTRVMDENKRLKIQVERLQAGKKKKK